MSNCIYAFLLTLLSGLSTLIGYFVINFNGNYNKLLASSLYFASGVMLFISLFDLIPESFKYISSYYFIIFSILLVILFVVVGIVTSMMIDKFLPNGDNNIYHLGIMTMIVIILHNLPEGIITYITATSNMKLGLDLGIAISLHNIPEGISIAVPIYYATKDKKKAFLYTFISGISEFFGAVLSYLFLSKYIDSFILGILFSIIAGIMIHISIYELIPNARKLNIKSSFIYFIFGAIIMFISIIL